MDKANTPRTTRDALILELLGDIGQCDDKVTALEKKLDIMPEAIEKAISPMLDTMAFSLKETQATISQLIAAEKASFENFVASEKIALQTSLKIALREEADKALASVARELATSARIHQDATKKEIQQRWQWITVAFAGSFLAAALSFYGSHLLYGKKMEEEAAFGRAIGTVWNSLDTKTKERILSARNNQWETQNFNYSICWATCLTLKISTVWDSSNTR